MITAPRSGSRRMAVCLTGFIALGVAVNTSCHSDELEASKPSARTETVTPQALEEINELTVPTYDGSGQSVHPDVVEFPREWNGWRYWLSMTPFPNSSERYENPSILVSDDGIQLVEREGASNPLVSAPAGKGSYNSDPELIFDQTSQSLLMFYRVVTDGLNSVRVVSSSDGVIWSQERLAFAAKSHDAVSPTVTPRTFRTPPLAWTVEAGKRGCKTSRTRIVVRQGVEGTTGLASATWSAPKQVELIQPGYVVWHMKVRFVPSRNEYWALYSAFQATRETNCRSDDLFFARSTDGVRWTTYPRPLLRRGGLAWTSAAIYRSTFVYNPADDELRVWLSSLSTDNHWHIGFARFNLSATLALLATPDAVEPASVPAPRRVPRYSEAP